MPGKPYKSKLQPYESELYKLSRKGLSYRKIAEDCKIRYGLDVTHNAIFSFMKAKSRRRKFQRKIFHDGLDADIRDSLMKQIVAVWTYDSTAIEGNTLTLGETVRVLEFGLTINGKPLKDHQEVYGHARAIDLIHKMLSENKITEDHLFDLHKAVMPQSSVDVYNPIGAWKQENNGTTGVDAGKTKYVEYSTPSDVPALMSRWLKAFNELLDSCSDPKTAVEEYSWAHMAFVRIHPFFDGNGRMARLLSNIPVMRAGFPPIVISQKQRAKYIGILWENQLALGQLKRKEELLPAHNSTRKFEALVTREWKHIYQLVDEAREKQKAREK